MTPTLCTCGHCNVCAMQGTAAPRDDSGSAARDYAAIVAASDGHAQPARPRRRTPADATPGLFDTTPEDSRRDL